MAILMDGKALAAEKMEELRQRTEALKARGVTPGLSVILVGEDPASQVYVRNKGRACEELGFYSRTIRMPEETTQAELEHQIDELNADGRVDGILVQLPLPRHLDEAAALRRIRPEKDVDGFHVENAGRLFTGQDGVVACTPKGILYMLKKSGVPLSGKDAVVIGRSNIVGKPVAMLLLNENCTVTLCHSRTADLAAHTRRADVLVAAVGRPRFVTADMVKPGAAVVDVGINRVDGKVVGDVDFAGVEPVAGWISPVPGGVGKMTICMLMENTLEAAEKRSR
ncbi:MAG: bifunctional methylenetetrahydrofolate dehydrogenase/methenyltetrahydrofolate cyclohydrolase FolD [Clostridiales bacterium]|nr:bifunctional methylenetetrahydrofolate dehydrogenase/methenyltetrahydrofolate cyclohydrolase FolD [Clostridiales bacterium]